MSEIKVFIIDDHEVVINGLKFIISKYRDIKIIGSSTNGKEAMERIRDLLPDIVIMDLKLPDISGIELTRTINSEGLKSRVIFHTSNTDPEKIMESFDAGCWSYIPKDFEADDLVNAIYSVSKGERYIKGKVSEIFIDNYFKIKKTVEVTEKIKSILSDREIEVLKLIAQGLSHHEIADKLFISIKTVNAHKQNIMKKLDIRSNADLIKYSIKNNIIKL
jgi:DNA-binding NarL/FixJ family response regulator